MKEVSNGAREMSKGGSMGGAREGGTKGVREVGNLQWRCHEDKKNGNGYMNSVLRCFVMY